ncbi:MAG: HU family DNA-binding protein [Saprospiraceae bacterium]|nr:HU family DNA-binding protein [Saprospiraceae bacterium]
MNKGDLINVVAEAAGITKLRLVARSMQCSVESNQALKVETKCAFVGFGTFSTAHKPAREGRNPSTGKTIQIEAKTSVKFKAGKSLTDAVN